MNSDVSLSLFFSFFSSLVPTENVVVVVHKCAKKVVLSVGQKAVWFVFALASLNKLFHKQSDSDDAVMFIKANKNNLKTTLQ